MDGELGQENIAIAFNKGKNKDLREKADKSVEELIKDGTVSKLSKKYFSGIDATYKNNLIKQRHNVVVFFSPSHHKCEISQKRYT